MAAQAEASVRLSLVDRISAPIRRIQARMAAMSRGLGIDRIGASFGNLTRRIGGLGSAMGRVTGRLSAFTALAGLGGGGAIAAAYGLADRAASLGDEIAKTSRQLGIGAEALQEYRYAAEMSGVSQETLENALKKFGVNASEAANGNKALATEFSNLGIQVKDSSGNMRDMESVFTDAVAAIASIESPMDRSRAAMRLFGRAGIDMTRLFEIGADGVADLRTEARLTGHVMSQEAAEFGEVFGDNVARLTKRFEGLQTMIGVRLMPVLDDAVVKVTAWYDANQVLIRSTITEWIERLSGLLADLIDPTSDIRLAFDQMANTITSVSDTISPFIDMIGIGNSALMLMGLWIGGPLIAGILNLIPAIAKLGLAFLTTPFGWIILGIALVAGAIYLLIDNWDAVVAAWNGAWARIVEAWTSFRDAIARSWDAFVEWGAGLATAIAEWFSGIDLGAIGTTMLTGYFNAVTGFWATVAGWGLSLAAEIAGWFNIDLYAVGEAIVATLLSGLQAAWGQVTGWFDGAINNLINAIPEWARGPLGIQVSGQPMTEGDMASRARQDGQTAADRVPGAGWFDSQENKDAADQAKALAFLQAEGAALTRLRAENARPAGLGANLSAPSASLAAPSAVPVETPTVTAGTVTTQSLTVPEPLLVREPQTVNAPFNATVTINVPPGFTEAQARSMINGAFSQQAAEHRAGLGSALND